jgi:hypothetical protein
MLPMVKIGHLRYQIVQTGHHGFDEQQWGHRCQYDLANADVSADENPRVIAADQ